MNFKTARGNIKTHIIYLEHERQRVSRCKKTHKIIFEFYFKFIINFHGLALEDLNVTYSVFSVLNN